VRLQVRKWGGLALGYKLKTPVLNGDCSCDEVSDQ
jgi:hypothetical protein